MPNSLIENEECRATYYCNGDLLCIQMPEIFVYEGKYTLQPTSKKTCHMLSCCASSISRYVPQTTQLFHHVEATLDKPRTALFSHPNREPRDSSNSQDAFGRRHIWRPIPLYRCPQRSRKRFEGRLRTMMVILSRYALHMERDAGWGNIRLGLNDITWIVA